MSHSSGGRPSLALIGKSLRDARVHKGISIDQVAQETRISPRFLQALEDERFDELPAPVYVRGFLRSYANFLQLDPEPLVAELTGAGARPGSPEGFVPGPSVPNGQRVRRSNGRTSRDPFSRQAPARGGGVEAMDEPELPPVPVLPRPSGIEAEAWAPEGDDTPEPVAFRPRGVAVAPVPPIMDPDVYDAEDAYPEFADDEEHPRRVTGMLLERPDQGEDSNRLVRIAALVGVFLLVGIAALGAYVFFVAGGDDNDKPAAVVPSPTSRPTNVIAVTGSPTASPTANASVSPTAVATESPSPTASVSPTAETTPTATATAGTPFPTATRGPATATPVPPTATNAPAPTATPVPPTSTPTRIPTPAPTPTRPIVQPGSQGYSECIQGDCGTSPYRVVCAPSGWFLDRPPYFDITGLGWAEVYVEKTGQAQSVCGN